jgi:hypothetical protein
MSDIWNIKKYVISECCVLLGSGSSINNITLEQWETLKRYDLFAVNNWVYHPFIVPNFYHIESKWYDYEILQNRLLEKRDLYKNTKFIFPENKIITLKSGFKKPLKDIVFDNAQIYTYKMKSRDPKRLTKTFNAEYSMDKNLLTKSYDMSLTLILELIYRMGYKYIILLGIDLINSYYFWTNKPEYGQVHHQTNKEHEGKNPELPHATYNIKDYIISFNNYWMCPPEKSLLITHKETALYPYIPMVEILK